MRARSAQYATVARRQAAQTFMHCTPAPEGVTQENVIAREASSGIEPGGKKPLELSNLLHGGGDESSFNGLPRTLAITGFTATQAHLTLVVARVSWRLTAGGVAARTRRVGHECVDHRIDETHVIVQLVADHAHLVSQGGGAFCVDPLTQLIHTIK
jgi:hypothetical protein